MGEAIDKDGRPIKISITMAELEKQKKRTKKKRGLFMKVLIALGVLKEK